MIDIDIYTSTFMDLDIEEKWNNTPEFRAFVNEYCKGYAISTEKWKWLDDHTIDMYIENDKTVIRQLTVGVKTTDDTFWEKLEELCKNNTIRYCKVLSYWQLPKHANGFGEWFSDGIASEYDKETGEWKLLGL